MSRHHPYAGYDEPHGSGFSGGGPRKNGRHATRGAPGSSGWLGRRGGHDGHRGNWDSEVGSERAFSDFGEYGHDNFMTPRGGPGGGRKSGKSRGSRGKGKAQMTRADVGERELTIDERIQRERPCRTLFVRNVKYETNPQELREKFEAMGEIKTFFDLIPNRGMIFVTYYDIRAATKAKEQLQEANVSGRPIDVHYSLPKDNELEKRCDRDKNQATLFLAISGANRVIDDEELRAKFGMYGEVRSIKQFKESPYQRFVEFWDTRACESAYDNLVGTNYLGGKLDLKFSWDTGMVPKTRLPRDMRGGYPSETGGRDDYDQYHGHHGRNESHGYGSGQMYDGYREGRNSFDSGRGHAGYSATSSFGQEYNDTMRMRGPSGSNAISAASQSNTASFGQSHEDAYQTPLVKPPNTNHSALSGGQSLLPNLASESSESRLNQAQKVQDLLASLANRGNSGPGSSLAAPSFQHSNTGYSSNQPMSLSTVQSAYGLALPAPAIPNSYTTTYPSYSSIPANNYQSHTTQLSGTSDSHALGNLSLTNPTTQIANFGQQLRSQLSASSPSASASLFPSMADQAHLSRSTSAAAGPLTPASGISPAILTLLSQASANNPSNTCSTHSSGADAIANAYPLPSAGPFDPSPSVTTASGPVIPTAPRAMQAYTTPSEVGATRLGHATASAGMLNNGTARGAVNSPSLPTLAGTTNNNDQATAPASASSQAAIQQLLVLLQQRQQSR